MYANFAKRFLFRFYYYNFAPELFWKCFKHFGGFALYHARRRLKPFRFSIIYIILKSPAKSTRETTRRVLAKLTARCGRPVLLIIDYWCVVRLFFPLRFRENKFINDKFVFRARREGRRGVAANRKK